MDEKVLYILLGLAYLAFQYFGNLKKKQREAEKKHPPPPRRDAAPTLEDADASEQPRFDTLEDIIRRAAEESRRQREEARRQREEQKRKVQPQRTWVNEKQKPAPRKQSSPFLTQDNPDYRDPRMETISTLEGESLETIGEEGTSTFSDMKSSLYAPGALSSEEQIQPTINLRQAMLHQVILQRPEY